MIKFFYRYVCFSQKRSLSYDQDPIIRHQYKQKYPELLKLEAEMQKSHFESNPTHNGIPRGTTQTGEQKRSKYIGMF